MKNLKIFLSGGGNEKQTVKLDNVFRSYLKKDKPLLYIPHAANLNKFKRYYSWVSGVFKNLKIELIRDLSKIKLEHLFSNFSGIYIGGGSTYKLKEIFIKTNFWDVLYSYALDGNPVYGGSAGALILGKNISACDGDRSKADIEEYSGLSLVKDYSMTCHFNGALDLAKYKDINKLIVLPEETGLFYDGTSFKAYGTKKAYFINITTCNPRINQSIL